MPLCEGASKLLSRDRVGVTLVNYPGCRVVVQFDFHRPLNGCADSVHCRHGKTR